MALSIILTVFWDAHILLLPTVAYCTQNISNLIPTPGVCLMGSPFLVLLIAIVLIRVPSMRKYLTTTNLVYLYVTSLAVAYFANTSYPWEYVAGLKFSRIFSSESDIIYVPEFVAPSRNVAELMWRGVGNIGAIPWAALLPTITWYFFIAALFGCISISLANIFRREWIDVEMMPFPHTMLAYATLVNVESSVKPSWPSKMPFLLGILFGFLLEAPVSAVTLFPWFPDILMWRTGTCGPGSHWIAPSDIPWHLGVLKNPPIYAVLLLAPLHFLFSMLFYVFVLEIALFVAYYGFGYYTGMLQMGFCGRNWCTPTPYHDPPLYFAVINTGCILGFFVITIILQRRYIIDTLKAAFGKSRETSVEEPMSYRSAWIMLIASFIAMIIFFGCSGLSPLLSFAIILSGVITWFVAVQVWGRAGVDWDSPCYNFTPGFVRLLVYPSIEWPKITSTDLALGPVITTMWSGTPIIGWGGSFYTAMASYTMARLTKVSSKNVLKVMVVAIFTSILTTHLAEISLLGIFGGSRFPPPTIRATPINVDRWGNFWAKPTGVPMTEVIPWVVVGFIFMVVMRYLCSRILWLPDPLAAIPAWSWTVSLHGLWLPCLVAWVIKSIVLKLGGSKLYEERVVPFVGGFILGTTLEIFVTALTSYVLFPPPI